MGHHGHAQTNNDVLADLDIDAEIENEN